MFRTIHLQSKAFRILSGSLLHIGTAQYGYVLKTSEYVKTEV